MPRKLLMIVILATILALGYNIVQHNQVTAPQPKQPLTVTTVTPSFDKTRYSTTDPNSVWVVVNKQHPLQPLDYAPADLSAVGNGQLMRAEAATELGYMRSAASTAGLVITAASGYRSYTQQQTTYDSEVKSYGQSQADSESARPGYSEHQTGWAVDLASGGCSVSDCFAGTPGGQWATANAYKYGFILRYSAEDTDITGYRAEAWHFRYVGVDLATELHDSRTTTLEQFFKISGGATYN